MKAGGRGQWSKTGSRRANASGVVVIRSFGAIKNFTGHVLLSALGSSRFTLRRRLVQRRLNALVDAVSPTWQIKLMSCRSVIGPTHATVCSSVTIWRFRQRSSSANGTGGSLRIVFVTALPRPSASWQTTAHSKLNGLNNCKPRNFRIAPLNRSCSAPGSKVWSALACCVRYWTSSANPSTKLTERRIATSITNSALNRRVTDLLGVFFYFPN